jgi:DNA invertase Pin-like site-specific DNA recombinase
MQGQKYVAYYRVSTDKQGKSGLGLEGQRACVVARVHLGHLIGEYTEVVSGRARYPKRPELAKAIEHAKREGATLIVAKLDRMARSVSFLFDLRESGVNVEACDQPEFNTLTLGIFATMAQYEAELIGQRTAAALEAKREREGEWRVGGFSEEARQRSMEVRQAIAEENPNNKRARKFAAVLRAQGLSYGAIAAQLMEAGVLTSRGSDKWRAQQVKRLLV